MAQVVEALGETGGKIKVEVAENTRQFGKYLGQQGEALGEYYRNARAENPLLVGIPAEIVAGLGTFLNLAEEGFKELGERSLEELFGEAAAQELMGKGREAKERVSNLIDRNLDPDQKRAVVFAVSVATLGSLVKQGVVAVGKDALELRQKAFKGKNDRASADSGVEAPRANALHGKAEHEAHVTGAIAPKGKSHDVLPQSVVAKPDFDGARVEAELPAPHLRDEMHNADGHEFENRGVDHNGEYIDPRSIKSKLLLKQDLEMEQMMRYLFVEKDDLGAEIVKEAKDASGKLKNPLVKAELIKDGSNFDDWAKYDLRAEIVKEARFLKVDINNQLVKAELTKDGSDFKDWGKFTTKQFDCPWGKCQFHFYMNKITGEINKNIDYKIKVTNSKRKRYVD